MPDARAPLQSPGKQIEKSHASVALRRGGSETRADGEHLHGILGRAELGAGRLASHEVFRLQRTLGNKATSQLISASRYGSSENRESEREISALEAHAAEVHTTPAHSASQTTVVQRFGSAEHKSLGNQASGGAKSDINIGTDAVPEFLSYGEVVALSGDYFGSLAEIRNLAKDQAGRAKIRWTRWLAIDKAEGVAEPPLSEDDKKAIKDHYFTLASDNISHFSAGGTADNTYEGQHTEALRLAFQAGAGASQAAGASGVKGFNLTAAQTQEAFAQHFLSDMFSGGHVRTERISIKAWYQTNMPNATAQIVAYMAHQMHGYLKANLPAYKQPFIPSEADIAVEIKKMGGKALDAFGMGEIVSLGWHNADSKGIDVVSDADESGTVKAGGAKWRDVGDGQLNTSQTTNNMAVAAMRASLAELTTAASMGSQLAAGTSGDAGFQTALASFKPFAANKFIPRNDASGTNQNMVWEWQFMNKAMYDAVDEALKTDIVANIREIAAKQDSPKKEALEDFAGTLEIIGIHALEVAVGQDARIAPVPNYGLYKDQKHPYYATPQFQE